MGILLVLVMAQAGAGSLTRGARYGIGIDACRADVGMRTQNGCIYEC